MGFEIDESRKLLVRADPGVRVVPFVRHDVDGLGERGTVLQGLTR